MYTTIGEGTAVQLHWLFRSNIPRRRGMPMPNDVRKRNFFGIGEIIGVLANVRIVVISSAFYPRRQSARCLIAPLAPFDDTHAAFRNASLTHRVQEDARGD